MKQILPALVALAAVTFAVSPYFATRFDGFDPMQFPVPQDNPPVQPAGWAFSIWGLIYLWLIAGAIFGLLKRADSVDWAGMRIWLVASLGLGTFWLSVAIWSPVWAAVLIWIMLITAIIALLRAGVQDRWWQRSPIGIYAGWLTAASSVSIGLLLAGYGILAAVPAALIAIAIALVVALFIQDRRRDTPEYALAVIWALCGVIAANLTPIVAPVVGLAAIGVALLIWRIMANRLK